MTEYSHNNDRTHDEEHGHTHGIVDPSIATSEKGLWAVKWSSIVLFFGAFLQLIVVFITGSVSLLSDTIHNFGDAATALPLGIAFLLGRKKPNNQFTYGYGKVEDIAGVIVLIFMVASAIGSGYLSIQRLFHPQAPTHLVILVIASFIGFGVNEWAASFRIRTGKQIHSEALIADGKHARMDGLTSLSVILSAVGVWFGFPLADPLVGLFITLLILKTTVESGKAVFTRLMDGVEPGMIEEIQHAAEHVSGVEGVTNARVRWVGHRLHVSLNISVDPKLSVENGHTIAKNVQQQLTEHVPNLSVASIHVDPTTETGEGHHIEHIHHE